MSLLSDHDIRQAIEDDRLSVTPWDPECLQPASYDVHLGEGFREIAEDAEPLDPVSPGDYTRPAITTWHYVLKPGAFVLGTTVESVKLSGRILGRLDGKSSLGRLGLMVHATAGYLDPGFEGTITLELSNSGPRAILLRSGAAIGQLSFSLLSSPADRPYGSKGLGSHYQHQSGTTASRS